MPALDHGLRSPAEWLATFEASGGRDRDALWAFYYGRSNEGAPRAEVEDLRAWMSRTPSAAVRRDLETILAQWRVEYEPVALQADGPPDTFTLEQALDLLPDGPDAWYVLPEADPVTSEATLWLDLAASNVRKQCDAAVELARRGVALEDVIESLVKSLHAYPAPPGALDSSMIMNFGARTRTAFPIESARAVALANVLHAGGAEASRLVLEMAADARRDQEQRRELWRFLLGRRSSDAWIEGFARVDLPTDAVVEEFRAGFADDLSRRLHLPTRAHVARGWPVHQRRPEAALRALLAELERRIDADSSSVESVELAGRLGAASSLARESLRTRLLGCLAEDEPAAEPAVYWLAQWGEGGPELRSAYVRVLQRLDAVSPDAPTELPLLENHDAETLAALRSLYGSAGAPRAFVHALGRAGLLDSDAEQMAAGLVAALEADDPGAWHEAFSAGLRGRLGVEPAAADLVQACRLGATIRAARAAGESFAEERALLISLLDASGEERELTIDVLGIVSALGLVDSTLADWCIDVMLADVFFPGDRSLAVVGALSTVELSRAQKARLYRLRLEGEGIVEVQDFLARQGPDVLELAGALRSRVEAGDLGALDAVLSIARPTPRDLATIRAAIDGPDLLASERAREIAARHGLDLRARR